MPAENDLDAFMKQVVARRDDNWKKLQQYVFDEREQLELRGRIARRSGANGASTPGTSVKGSSFAAPRSSTASPSARTNAASRRLNTSGRCRNATGARLVAA